MSDLHLIDITVRPCAYVNDVIMGSWRNIQSGMVKDGGKVVYGFKVCRQEGIHLLGIYLWPIRL